VHLLQKQLKGISFEALGSDLNFHGLDDQKMRHPHLKTTKRTKNKPLEERMSPHHSSKEQTKAETHYTQLSCALFCPGKCRDYYHLVPQKKTIKSILAPFF
jgi:hypothetical protein